MTFKDKKYKYIVMFMKYVKVKYIKTRMAGWYGSILLKVLIRKTV